MAPYEEESNKEIKSDFHMDIHTWRRPQLLISSFPVIAGHCVWFPEGPLVAVSQGVPVLQTLGHMGTSELCSDEDIAAPDVR